MTARYILCYREVERLRQVKMKKIIVFCTLTTALFQGGCGIIGVLGTPTRHEREIPAEYDLTSRKDHKVLVLVNRSGRLGAADLPYYLTGAINKHLGEKTKTALKRFVSFKELSEFRSNQADFSLLGPVEVGNAMDANMVLLVEIDICELKRIAETSYYNGFLAAQAVLFDTATAERLWPGSVKNKSIKVGFDIEPGGREAAVKRLASACAHCIVRYLYNCPMDKFKTFDEKSDPVWGNWNN